MARLKSIKEPEIKKLIKECEDTIKYVEEQKEPWISVGYTVTMLKYMIKKLNGDFPI